ncbi:MAG: hypothetical protein WEA61_07805 [Anaerolineales bacterium]
MMKFASFLSITSLISLLLAACGASPTAAPTETGNLVTASGPLDVCALITQAEAEAMLGEETGGPERGDTPPIFSCFYRTDSFDIVQVIVTIYSSGVDARDAFEATLAFNAYPRVLDIDYPAYSA